MGPASTMPAAPPTASMAATTAMLEAIFSRGASSRMMPNASGRVAPPMPCSTRATIISPMVVDSAPSTEPTATTNRVATRIFFLPNMSPARPRIGVATDAASR